ncbi:MAG TPA: Holliday junction branch migration protein RuvA [Clostridiaceae bacterium]|nr:Holliday junction branch migration protein RuvA [Clostridiaceae bacterium]
MIAVLKGKILQKYPESMIVTVQGIGFEIFYDPLMAGQFPAIGEEVTVWTYMNVRENEMSLYGFPNQEIKKLYELLITVSGIGPKVASGIVGGMSPERFAMAVLNDDVKSLTQIKGIGNKGAQRIILELKDKVKKSLPKLNKDDSKTSTSIGISADGNLLSVGQESIAALMVLGYQESEAEKALEKAYYELKEKEIEIAVESLLKYALKHLSVL